MKLGIGPEPADPSLDLLHLAAAKLQAQQLHFSYQDKIWLHFPALRRRLKGVPS